MNETVEIWLFGGVGGCIVAGVLFAFAISQRLTRLETILDVLGKKAARLLHSPDDHLGIDSLLDKYIGNHYDLEYEDWRHLKLKCEAIEHNPEVRKDERLLAAFVSALATHKMMRHH